VHFLQQWLRIKGIDVRGSALHHEEDDVLGLRTWKMRLLRGERVRFLGFGEQRGQSHAAERGPEAIDEVAACRRVQGAGASAGEEGAVHEGNGVG
jgi:hypothetical protein